MHCMYNVVVVVVVEINKNSIVDVANSVGRAFRHPANRQFF